MLNTKMGIRKPIVLVQDMEGEYVCSLPNPIIYSMQDTFDKIEFSWSKNQVVFGVDEEEKKRVICILVARQVTQNISPQKWMKYSRMIKESFDKKPNIQRGYKRNQICNGYISYGFRKEPLGKQIGEYSFKNTTNNSDKMELKTGIESMINDIELHGNNAAQ